MYMYMYEHTKYMYVYMYIVYMYMYISVWHCIATSIYHQLDVSLEGVWA